MLLTLHSRLQPVIKKGNKVSTRGITKFFDGTPEDYDNFVAMIYRHSDSYPEGAGVDLYKFLGRVGKLDDSRFCDPSYLAAKYVVFLAEIFSVEYDWSSSPVTTRPKSDRLDFLSVGIQNTVPSDVEFIYHLYCGVKPKIKCFEAVEDTNSELRWKPMIEGEEITIPKPKRVGLR